MSTKKTQTQRRKSARTAPLNVLLYPAGYPPLSEGQHPPPPFFLSHAFSCACSPSSPLLFSFIFYLLYFFFLWCHSCHLPPFLSYYSRPCPSTLSTHILFLLPLLFFYLFLFLSLPLPSGFPLSSSLFFSSSILFPSSLLFPLSPNSRFLFDRQTLFCWGQCKGDEHRQLPHHRHHHSPIIFTSSTKHHILGGHVPGLFGA